MQARMSRDAEAVLTAKIELGEAGPVWWSDDAADFSGATPESSPYAAWWNALSDKERAAGQ